MTTSDQYASVRYLVDDVQAAIDFYTTHFGFTLRASAGPAFADVVRGPLRLLLSGPASSGARATPEDTASAGRNRIHLNVHDLDSEIERLRKEVERAEKMLANERFVENAAPDVVEAEREKLAKYRRELDALSS